MRVCLNGPFRVYDDIDTDITPCGIKERGLFALLLMSPGQRRSRAWVQDKLWSDRAPDQASGSCRQALSNMRKALGSEGTRIRSDRSAIWIDPPVPLHGAFDLTQGDLLDDIDIKDPEFCDWLRTLRMQQNAPAPNVALAASSPAAPLIGAPEQRARVPICLIDQSGTARGMFILRALSQRISAGLAVAGDLDIIERPGDVPPDGGPTPHAVVELECLDDSDQAFVLLRVSDPLNRRVLWSGRLSIAPRLVTLWDSEDVARAVNRTVQAVCDTTSAGQTLSPMVAINRAIRRVFECDRAGLAKADQMLAVAVDSPLKGPALAWRAFVRLSEALEFREQDAAKLATAMPLVQDAMQASPDHPVVLALASEVTLRMTGDLDAAHYLALRAAALGEDNPYALDALSQTLIIQQKYDAAHSAAQRARLAAQGLAHSSSWDLLACFTAIGVGDRAGALDLALSCHRKMPFYRPALRYLTALSCLTDRAGDARVYAAKLRRLEPDFEMAMLRRDSYPISTLRDLGLMDELSTHLA